MPGGLVWQNPGHRSATTRLVSHGKGERQPGAFLVRHSKNPSGGTLLLL